MLSPRASGHCRFLHCPPALLPQILKIDVERKAIVLKGTLPGKTGAVLEVSVAKIVGKNC